VWVSQNKKKYFRGFSVEKKRLDNTGLEYCEKVKEKITFTLEQAMKAQRGADVYPCSSLNLGTRRGWVVNATPRPLYPWERLCTHCI